MMFGKKLFGRKGGGGDDQGLALQRNAYRETLAHFSEFDGRVQRLDELARAFAEVWQEPAEVTQLKRDCEAIRKMLAVMGERLDMATGPLPDIEEPLMATIDRVESGEVVIQNLVVTLTTKQAMLNTERQSRGDA